ncbi:arsenate reductase (glutaredoxin) [Sinirhodobacter huangdaonensis]|uniref:Arsenate reductase n=1 Tax=Paenirhodobacter huangdaonensis TaxID=2501515 RepID=A0A443LSG2_9RHOB|nr:arsenate reductase (glutaredoxin) [Sinirhodobacter huangdaonensis]RWR52124.1 arsenate reductase (glutaredoxin) [Sinirhodobacter huangdaonensis]
MALTIWHNPRCTKSRETLALLQARGLTPAVRLYLDDAPTRAELADALAKLGRPAADLVRWKEADVPAGLTRTAPEAAILDALAAHPRLIERPLVLTDRAARIGRPPEAVLEIL